MTTRNQIQATQAVQDYTRRNARLVYYGALGNNAGTVDHATRNDWVYVRLHGDSNQVVEAYAAASFPHVNNVVVDVEKVLRKGAPYYQILGVSAGITYATTDNPFAGMPGYHASTHQRRDRNAGGPDPLDIYNRALVNLRARAQATPDMTLYVERGFYVITSFKEWTGGNSAAFTACPPFFVRWDLLYLGNDDALHILEGTAVLSSSTPAYPTVPANCIPIAYVYRSGDQTCLDEADITDARTILSSNQATASAHNLLSAVHGDTLTASVVAGDVIIGNDTPKWSRLAITVPAANVRNVLGVDNGETKPSWKTALDATAPTTIAEGAAAAAGTSLVFAHRDHTHGAPATWAPTKWGSGTAFPGSPSSGYRFFRTDLGFLCYYDGTRWLSETVYMSQAPLTVASANGNQWASRTQTNYAPYVTRYELTTYVFATNDGTNYWTVNINSWKADISASTLVHTFNTSGDTQATYVIHAGTPGTTQTPANYGLFDVAFTKTNTPGNMYVWETVFYRLIVT